MLSPNRECQLEIRLNPLNLPRSRILKRLLLAVTACAAGKLAGQVVADPVIDAARRAASTFTESLPQYNVERTTVRYQTDAAPSLDHHAGRQTGTQARSCNRDVIRSTPGVCPHDTVTADVMVEKNGRETYANIRVNGKPEKDPDQTGTWSEGEFSSTLWAIFSPASGAVFTNPRLGAIVKRPAWIYDFSIDHSHSSWHLRVEREDYAPAYSGQIWIDKETSRVLMVQMAALDLPASFPLRNVESAMEYNFVNIGGAQYLLPARSVALYCQRDGTVCSKNVTEFENYRQYSAKETITFDEAPK